MTSRPSTEQLLVQVLMRASQEVLRTFVECSDEAPEREQAQHELDLAFESIWSRIPLLELTCRDDGLLWHDVPVLTRDEDEYGLARTLAGSGIHTVTLSPGAERAEMMQFLRLVDRKSRLDEGGDQDLVLMLFRADLHHLRYTVGTGALPTRPAAPGTAVDTGPALPAVDLGGTSLPEESLSTRRAGHPQRAALEHSAEGLREQLREDAVTEDPERGIVRLEKFDSTLYFLDQKEIEYLQGAIDREYSQDHSTNVLALLLDILQLRADPDVRDEVIGILQKLLPYLLGTGRFNAVAYLTSELRTVTRATTFEPRHKDALDSLRVSISRQRALTQLFHVLDDGSVEPTAEELGVLLREMQHDAVRTVLVWLGQMTSPHAKSALIEALDGLFRQWPGALSRMTASGDRTVVQRALGVAKRLKLPDFVEAVEEALSAEDASTRKLAVSTLSAIGTAPAIKSLTRTLDDEDASVRVTAYQALTSRPWRGAQKELREALGASDLESRELSERRALFSAFGAVAGPGGVSTLEPVLLGKGGLARRPSPETRACAAVALGAINTPAARFALESVSKDREPLVRSAARSALRNDRAR